MSMLVLMRRKEQTNLFREIAEIFAYKKTDGFDYD